MRKIYREHKHHTDLNAADLEQIYNHDYQIALKYHKHMRLVFIRSQRKQKLNQFELCEDEEFLVSSKIETINPEFRQ